MDIWLDLLRDYEEFEKERKAKALSEKGRKKPAVVLRERMNQTIRERRAAERIGEGLASNSPSSVGDRSILESSQLPESSQSLPSTFKDRRSVNHPDNGDKAFASQRRTVDRVLESLSSGDEAMIMQMKETEKDKIDRWEAVERDKLDVLQRALGAQGVTEGASAGVAERLEVRVKAVEAQGAEIRRIVQDQRIEMLKAIEEQGQKIADQGQRIADQGQRTDKKLDMLLAILQQPR